MRCGPQLRHQPVRNDQFVCYTVYLYSCLIGAAYGGPRNFIV